LPKGLDLLFQLSDILRRKGNYKEYVEAWANAQIAAGNPQLAARGQEAYRQGGQRGFVEWQLHERESAAKKGYVSPVELANFHAQLGERKLTIDLLEEGYRQRSTEMLYLRNDPAYDFLNNDPQYRSILKRVGEAKTP
jgi:hypothetical protein